MNGTVSPVLKKSWKAGFILILWLFTAWLFYPLFTFNAIELANAKTYLYRSAIGIAIMLILFGKTIFDLLFPQTVSKARSILNTIFLVLYSIFIAGGVIYMASRIIVLYIRSSDTGSPF
jgi:hypothetical protein